MRKVFLTVIIATIVLSCGQKKEENNEQDNVSTINSEATTNEGMKSDTPEIAPEFQKGADLIAANDCLGCHKVNEKLVGPSYKEIAVKYSLNDLETLTNKIIAGGKGNWGEVPMTAHSALSQDDANEMVKYIMSLK